MYFHQQLLFDQGVRILHLLVVHKILVHEEQNVVQYLMEDQILNGSEKYREIYNFNNIVPMPR